MGFDSIAVVAGAPRSGTSWLGQIVDSSPQVVYRYQPLFSYAFKNFVDFDSPPQRWQELFERLYVARDDFLEQRKQRESGAYPTFEKDPDPRLLAFKETRYHYLLRKMLESSGVLRLVAVVRNPCAVVNSWIRNPREFPPGSDLRTEWRFGACKNEGREENFFGFYKWKELVHIFMDLRAQHPDRVHLVRYEDLLDRPEEESQRIFDFLGLQLGESTRRFLAESHQRTSEDPYGVFRAGEVRDRWRDELPDFIAREIERDLAGTALESYLR